MDKPSCYVVEVEKGKEAQNYRPSVGPVLRSVFAKDGFPSIPGAQCWDLFREKNGGFMVPTVQHGGARAVEFIICHAEVKLAFVEEKRISELLKTLPNTNKYLKTIVSFGNVTPEQKEEVKKHGVTIFTWEEFLQMGDNKQFDLPEKKNTDICAIMYTSGTTGDPNRVLNSNNSIVMLVAGVKHLLGSVNESLTEKDVYLSYLPLAHIFDRVIEEAMIFHGGSIGFWRGDAKLLVEDIGALQPSIFCAGPRVLERIHSALAWFNTKDLFRGSDKEDNVQLCILLQTTSSKQRGEN